MTPNNNIDCYPLFSLKFFWFRIFLILISKIGIWVVFPTQCSSLYTNLLSKLEIIKNHGILKLTLVSYLLNHREFQHFYLINFWHFNNKLLFSDENWVGKTTHMPIFKIRTQNIPNQMNLRGKKSITYDVIIWSQKLSFMRRMTNTNFF